MKKYWKLGLLFTLISVALLTGCGLSVRSIHAWLDTSMTTQGEVVSMREESSYDSQEKRTTYYYYPTTTFRSANGQSVEFESEVGSNPPAHQVGDRVDVRYQIARPTDARIDQFFELWLMPLVLGFLGIFFMLPGYLLTLTKAGQQSALSGQVNHPIKINL